MKFISDGANRSLSIQYFFYFGTLAVYLPYFNLYCHHLGLSGLQIGLVAGTRSTIMVIMPILWSRFADRKGNRTQLYKYCLVAATLLWIPFLFIGRFETVLIMSVVHALFYAPQIAFLEAMVMAHLKENRNAYGRLRVWGSVSFILVVTGLGQIITLTGSHIIPALILLGSTASALLAWPLSEAPASDTSASFLDWKKVLHPRFVFFLFCGFLMLLSHGAYYGFFSIHLEALGYSGRFIGVCWAVAVGCEIVVMLSSRRIFDHISMEKVLLVSFGIAALRWLILFKSTSPMLILASQILHAGTYGAFHIASILFVDHLTPKGHKTMGQAFNNAATYGMGLATGFFLNGYIFQAGKTGLLFGWSSLIAVMSGLFFGWQILARINRQDPDRPGF